MKFNLGVECRGNWDEGLGYISVYNCLLFYVKKLRDVKR